MHNTKTILIIAILCSVVAVNSFAQSWVNDNLLFNTADRGIQFYGGGEKIIGTAAWGIQFQTSNSTPRMTLLNNGYLGIGTVTPAEKLTLSGGKFRIEDPGNAYSNYLYSFAAISNYRSGLVMESNASVNFGLTGPDNVASVFRWLSINNATIDYSTNNNELMRLQKDGKLGLGVAPTATLHVFVPGSSSVVNGMNLDVQSFGNTANAFASHYFRIRDIGGNSTAFIVKGSGYVGINTANPDAYLTVKGDIHAKEVRVDMSVPGPDYVFEKDYKLLPLSELSLFLAKNKHLPEVPSATEMEKDGINVGDMNMTLLKKVEELTLYVIQQQEEMKKMMTEMELQKQEIQKLKSNR
ncbi:hypothetical protein SAMN04488109_5356 [Chryseolinea serpens]|uniref:Uncharacterized protein n=1 Tax=Chryseolinea serpens TaxID=947013 RepID=A0A1M5VSZ9_9BACT|nr:hypothetical protein [Chryseolinea serpens]SHH78043.1 hypothetical protein SAMN04488109_5356 [Chryseolinea serpens]